MGLMELKIGKKHVHLNHLHVGIRQINKKQINDTVELIQYYNILSILTRWFFT